MGLLQREGLHYHHQISSHALTHGPVVFSRLDDYIQPMPPATSYTLTHTNSPTSLHLYALIVEKKPKYPLTPSC